MYKLSATIMPCASSFIPNLRAIERGINRSCTVIEEHVNVLMDSYSIALAYDPTLAMEIAARAILQQCVSSDRELYGLDVNWGNVESDIFELVNADVYDGMSVGDTRTINDLPDFSEHLTNIVESFITIAHAFGKEFIRVPNFNWRNFDICDDLTIRDYAYGCVVCLSRNH